MRLTPLNVPNALGSTIGPSAPGCFTTLQWTADGDPKGKVELLRNFVPIFTGGIGPITFKDPFTVGTWTYMVRATNSDGIVAMSAPIQVTPACVTEYKIDIVDTCGECSELRHSWKVVGNQSGTVKIVHTPDSVTVATRPIAALSYTANMDYDCPNDYAIVVTIGTWSVTSPIVRAPGGFFSNCND
jgi:hypothetical protein